MSGIDDKTLGFFGGRADLKSSPNSHSEKWSMYITPQMEQNGSKTTAFTFWVYTKKHVRV